MKIIEDLRNTAKLNLCESCFKRYNTSIAPSIEVLLFNTIDDWREVESDITLMVMVTKGVLERENIYLSLDDGPILFRWNKIPVRDNGRLIKFLKHNYSIDWVKISKIEKIKGEKTIKLSTEENSISLRLNNEKTNVSLKIDDGRTDDLIAKKENKNLNIYKEDSNEVTCNELDYEEFFNIKKIDWDEFEKIKSKYGFTKKIDYLYEHKILGDFSHRVLDEANQVRNKIHNPSIVARFSEQDLILFNDAHMITDNIYNATMYDRGKEMSTKLKNDAEDYAKKCLLKLNFE